jgi:DNA replication protein DnaC
LARAAQQRTLTTFREVDDRWNLLQSLIRWHEQIGDPTVADGILDRLVHNAHRIEMRGDSMRKGRGKVNA